MTSSNLPGRNRDDAAAYIRDQHKLRCTAGYLAKLASIGGGPRFHKLDGYAVIYLDADLDAWAQTRLQGPFNKSSESEHQAHAA